MSVRISTARAAAATAPRAMEMACPGQDAPPTAPVVLERADEPDLARLTVALSQNPIADLYAAALTAREHPCWDCGAEIDADAQRTGYCEECAPDHPET